MGRTRRRERGGGKQFFSLWLGAMKAIWWGIADLLRIKQTIVEEEKNMHKRVRATANNIFKIISWERNRQPPGERPRPLETGGAGGARWGSAWAWNGTTGEGPSWYAETMGMGEPLVVLDDLFRRTNALPHNEGYEIC